MKVIYSTMLIIQPIRDTLELILSLPLNVNIDIIQVALMAPVVPQLTYTIQLVIFCFR